MRIAVFTAYFPPAYRGGGPVKSLGALMAHLPEKTAAIVVTRNTDLGSDVPLAVPSDEWVDHGDARVRYVSHDSLVSWWKTLRAIRSFRPDAVYVNSFFDMSGSIVPQLLARLGLFGHVVIVLAPRGEFGSGALALKSQKKRAYLRAFKTLGLSRSITWHASSEREKADILSVIGPTANVVIREDGTDLPVTADSLPGRPPGSLRAVHVARLVPIKGLDGLLIALRDVSVPLSLDVFGPAEDLDFVDRCRHLAELLPAHVTVTFGGTLDPATVRATVGRYDVMLFPTRGENFGHIVAESLSAACPVMCPDTTPWSHWLRAGGGVVVDPDTTANWSQAINDYASLSPDDLVERRREAAAVYAEWRTVSSRKPHLFTLLASSPTWSR